MTRTVAEAIAQTLKAYGTEYFFCMCGGDHALWYALKDAGIRIVNCRSENAAVYMADGYARISGRPGFVYGQRGPGVANLAGALADPLWAMSPVVSLTSSIALSSRDRYEYQELDGLPLHDAVTRWNKSLHAPERAAAMTRAAIRAATGPTPGPVHLEIPADMFADENHEEIYREEGLGRVNARRQAPDRAALSALLDRLLAAERPLILAGTGAIISEAWDALARLAETLGIPVATTLGGKGAMDEQSALAVGVIGRNSRRIGNEAVRDCDLVLAIGTRLGGLATHRWKLPFQEKIILQIDSDPEMLGHNYRITLGLLADAKLALEAALEDIAARRLARPRSAWASAMSARVAAWREAAARQASEQPGDGIHPARTIAALRRAMAPEDLIGADTGALGGWVGALFPVAAGRSIVRANGSLGWVFPGALGAALARPDRRTVAVTGDGGMMYHIAELETALRCDIPVIVVVLNNACLASEYHTQKTHGRLVPEVLDYRDVDFAAVARAFGAFGVRVEEAQALDQAIAQAFAAGKPALIDVRTSKEAQSPSANHDATRAV
jgi:acetolactate synthase-1/2/3 large subunit